MAALYIISGLALLIAFLLILPIRIRLIFGEDFELYVGYLFFRKKLLPTEKKEKGKKKASKKKEKTSPVASYLKLTLKEKGILKGIKEILKTVKELLAPLIPFLSKTVVKINNLVINVSSDDASKTALEYGAVTTFVGDGLTVMNEKTKLKKRNVYVYSDFISGESSIVGDITLKIRPSSIISLLISVVKVYVKRILKPASLKVEQKGDIKNG